MPSTTRACALSNPLRPSQLTRSKGGFKPYLTAYRGSANILNNPPGSGRRVWSWQSCKKGRAHPITPPTGRGHRRGEERWRGQGGSPPRRQRHSQYQNNQDRPNSCVPSIITYNSYRCASGATPTRWNIP